MKIIACTVAVCVVLSALALSACAGEQSQPKQKPVMTEPAQRIGFLARLANGARNVLVAPLDVPFTVVRHATETGNPIISAVSGTLEGVVNGTVRIVAGALEVVTSPVPGKRYPLYDRELGERCIRQKPAF